MRPRRGFPDVGTRYWLSVLAINIASALAAWFSFDALEESLYFNGALLTGKMNIHFCRSELVMAWGFKVAMTNHRHQSRLWIHEVVKVFRLIIISNRKLTII